MGVSRSAGVPPHPDSSIVGFVMPNSSKYPVANIDKHKLLLSFRPQHGQSSHDATGNPKNSSLWSSAAPKLCRPLRISLGYCRVPSQHVSQIRPHLEHCVFPRISINAPPHAGQLGASVCILIESNASNYGPRKCCSLRLCDSPPSRLCASARDPPRETFDHATQNLHEASRLSFPLASH